MEAESFPDEFLMSFNRKHLNFGTMVPERPKMETNPFTLGGFRVDPSRRIISGPNGDTTIEPKIMAVLQMLVARPGEVVTRQAFIDSIWSTEYGGDESLTRAVSLLRKVLNEAHGEKVRIETIPKTGYRLIIPRDSPATSGNRRKRATLFALVAAGLLAIFAAALFYGPGHDQPGSEAAQSIKASVVLAVLPFDIHGDASKDEPLAFGVADEILSALSRNPSLAVIAGNSSFQFQGDNKKDLSALGKRLNANYVVDGSLSRSPQGLRVGVHLINTGSGLVEWSEVVTRPEDEIYTIPGDVAAAVQTALGAEPIAEQPRLTAPDPAAYESYLYAKSLLRMPWGENLDTALQKLEYAVTLEPALSEAWATLAMTRVEQGFSEGPAKPKPGSPVWSERLQAARQDAETALTIDPGNTEAQLAMALIDYREQAVSMAETVNRVRSLLERAPNHPKLNFRMGMLMGGVGRFDDAVRYLGRALALDPLTFMNLALYADQLLCSGRMNDAMAFIRAQGAYERYQRAYTGLVMELLAGDYQMARTGFTDLGPKDIFIVDGVIEIPTMNIDSPNTQRLSNLMERLIDAAEQADVTSDSTLPSELESAADEGLILHFYVAQLLAAAGFQDAALDLAMRRVAEGDWGVREAGILLRPAFTQARQDPGIMEYFAKTGQLDYWLQTETWPDYCSDPQLPYDCDDAARRYRQQAGVQASTANTL
jgi:TolB-like protein/DNA-binding winged helix-turn-helix (wHTH) protein